MFSHRNTCCLSFMVTNIITNMFHNQIQTTQSILDYMPHQSVHQKGVDKQDKTEVALFMPTPFNHIWA